MRSFSAFVALFCLLGCKTPGEVHNEQATAAERPRRVVTALIDNRCVAKPVTLEVVAGKSICTGPVTATLLAGRKPAIKYTGPGVSPKPLTTPCTIDNAEVVADSASELCARFGLEIEKVQVFPGGYNVYFLDGDIVSHLTVPLVYLQPLVPYPLRDEDEEESEPPATPVTPSSTPNPI